MAKDDQNQDEPSAARQQEEAKESSQLGYFSRLRMGYNKLSGALKAREGDRSITQSLRPMKDMPADPMSVGAGRDERSDAALGLTTAQAQDTTKTDGDDTGDGSGSEGGDTSSSTGGSSSGGGPAPAPDAGYVSFADASTETKADVKGKPVQNQLAEQQKTEAEVAKKTENAPKAAKPTVTQTSAAPKAGAKGGPSGPSTGGGKGGGVGPTPG